MSIPEHIKTIKKTEAKDLEEHLRQTKQTLKTNVYQDIEWFF